MLPNRNNNNNKVEINRTPLICKNLSDLKAGDIVLFNASTRHKHIVDKFTIAQQSILNEEGAHKDVTHAGFIVEVDGFKKLAHVVGEGFFLTEIDPASPQYNADDRYLKYFKRTMHVYSLRNNKKFANHNRTWITQRLNVIAHSFQTSSHQQQSLKWRLWVAITSAIYKVFTSLRYTFTDYRETLHGDPSWVPQPEAVGQNTVCSRLVPDAFIMASQMHSQDQLATTNHHMRNMNISPFTLPSTLLAYLYRNRRYDYSVKPECNDLLNDLLGVIDTEMTRLGNDKNPLANKKANDMRVIINDFKVLPQGQDEMQWCIKLLKALYPVISINTGYGFKTPTSFTNIMSYARAQGIYHDYITKELVDRKDGKYSTLAQLHYQFGVNQSKCYSRYRGMGYSDQEAKFEANNNASFGDWYTLSPVRNIALTATVVGFFFYVLPRGLHRAYQVRARNQVDFVDGTPLPVLGNVRSTGWW